MLLLSETVFHTSTRLIFWCAKSSSSNLAGGGGQAKELQFLGVDEFIILKTDNISNPSYLSLNPTTGKQLPSGVWCGAHPIIHDHRQAGGEGR